MNDIFNFRRFRKYFVSDIKTITANSGIGLLSLGIVPLYIFIIRLFFGIVFGTGYLSVDARFGVFMLTVFLYVVWAPAACYGYITEKRAGSRFLLTPASTLEKVLGMLANMLFVFPLAIFSTYFVADILTTLVSGHAFSETLIAGIRQFDFKSLFSLTYWDTVIVNASSFISNILAFLLGALYFKKAKIAKTVLVIIGIGIIVSVFGLSWVKDSIYDISLHSSDPNIMEYFMEVSLISNTLISLALCTALYFRVRKMQH